MIICLHVCIHFSSTHICDLSHLNQKKRPLDRGLNLRSQSVKTDKSPTPRGWYVICETSFKMFPIFEQLIFPFCRRRHLFISIVFPTIWRLSLGHLCQSDILLVSSNGCWSDARKSCFAGCLTYIRAWTPLFSLTILVTSILVSEFLNTAYQVSWDSFILIFCDKYGYVFFKFIFQNYF